jgi:hypothetical protein
MKDLRLFLCISLALSLVQSFSIYCLPKITEETTSHPISIFFLGEPKKGKQFWKIFLPIASNCRLSVDKVECPTKPSDLRIVLGYQPNKSLALYCYGKKGNLWFSLKYYEKSSLSKLIKQISPNFVEILKDLQDSLPSAGKKTDATFPVDQQVLEEAKSALKVGGEVSSPKPISKVNPSLNDRATRLHLDGTLIFQLLIRKDGTAKVVKVVQPLPCGLTETIKNDLEKWTFEPARKSGEPVAVIVSGEVGFVSGP